MITRSERSTQPETTYLMKRIIPLLVLFGLLVVPTSMALAQTTGNLPTLPSANETQVGTTADSLIGFICQIFNWVFLALLLAAVAFVLVAAYRYLTAAGDAAKVTLANKTLILAAVAIAVALLARAVPVIVGSFVLSGNSSSSSFDVCP